MNLAWTFGDFVSPKQHRPDFAVSHHWAMGPIAHRSSPSPSSSAFPRNRTWQPHWFGGLRRDVITQVGGVVVEETLLPLVSGLAAGRRRRVQWCRMTTSWV